MLHEVQRSLQDAWLNQGWSFKIAVNIDAA